MENNIKNMEDVSSKIKASDKLTKIYKHFASKDYCYILVKQFDGLISNLKSIDALLKISNYEDAFTIFRKYMETYLVLLSVIANPTLASKYVYHDRLLGEKACGINKEEIEQIRKNNLDGYIQYGYLEDIVDTLDKNFKYTIKTVAKAANREDLYYSAYRPSNNFVHNNLTSVVVDTRLSDKLLKLCTDTTDFLIKKIHKIIN